jgi:hypothetical protein
MVMPNVVRIANPIGLFLYIIVTHKVVRIDISNLQNHPQDVAVYEIGIKNRSEQGKGRSLNNQSNFDN